MRTLTFHVDLSRDTLVQRYPRISKQWRVSFWYGVMVRVPNVAAKAPLHETCARTQFHAMGPKSLSTSFHIIIDIGYMGKIVYLVHGYYNGTQLHLLKSLLLLFSRASEASEP